MHTVLFVFEFLGTTELLVVAVVALILFGPRKLPEIGRTIGKGMAEFKRASDDFKRTWEYEVELEQRKPAPALDANAQTPALDVTATGGGAATALDGLASAPADGAGAEEFGGAEPQPYAWEAPVARGAADEDSAGGREEAEDARAGAPPARTGADEINAS